jgi:Carboxypeptidase regulatory-like domain
MREVDFALSRRTFLACRGMSMTRRFFLTIGVFAIQLFLNITIKAAEAYSASQRVTGTVSDASGQPVNEAKLVFQTEDGHIIARARSDRNGHFEFADIQPGTYAIVVNKPGFATATSIVTVTSRGVRPVNISMEAETALSMQVIAKGSRSPATGQVLKQAVACIVLMRTIQELS